MEFLSTHPLFGTIHIKHLQYLEQHLTITSVKRGTFIIHENIGNTQFFLIRSGIVQVIQSLQNRKRCTVDLLQNPEFFGETAFLYKYASRGNMYYYAYTDCILLSIKHQHLYKITQLYPHIKSELHDVFCLKAFQLQRFLGNSIFQSLIQKIADLFLYLASKFGVFQNNTCSIQIKVTHKLMSEFIGTSRETITKTFRKMKRMNLIKYTNEKKLILLNVEALRKIIQE